MTTKRFTLGEELVIGLNCLTWSNAYELAKWLKGGVRKPDPLQTSPEIFVREKSVIIRAHPDDRETIKAWAIAAAKMKEFEIQNE